MDARTAEVRRVLGRYLEEVVEAYNLCPWAAAARRGGEVAIAVLFGTPDAYTIGVAADALLARPETRVAMVVLPELGLSRAAFRDLRERVVAQVPTAGVAEFHPDAPLDLATPARAVPFCRRSPDPLLQLVPLALLDAIRGAPHQMDRAQQLATLGGYSTAPRAEVTDRIAATNHATLAARGAAIAAVLDAIAADRAAAYARVGISSSR